MAKPGPTRKISTRRAVLERLLRRRLVRRVPERPLSEDPRGSPRRGRDRALDDDGTHLERAAPPRVDRARRDVRLAGATSDSPAPSSSWQQLVSKKKRRPLGVARRGLERVQRRDVRRVDGLQREVDRRARRAEGCGAHEEEEESKHGEPAKAGGSGDVSRLSQASQVPRPVPVRHVAACQRSPRSRRGARDPLTLHKPWDAELVQLLASSCCYRRGAASPRAIAAAPRCPEQSPR